MVDDGISLRLGIIYPLRQHLAGVRQILQRDPGAVVCIMIVRVVGGWFVVVHIVQVRRGGVVGGVRVVEVVGECQVDGGGGRERGGFVVVGRERQVYERGRVLWERVGGELLFFELVFGGRGDYDGGVVACARRGTLRGGCFDGAAVVRAGGGVVGLPDGLFVAAEDGGGCFPPGGQHCVIGIGGKDGWFIV